MRARGSPGTDPATWRRPAPVLDDLRRILLEVPAGTAARAVAEDLAARLEPYVAGGALDGFLNRPTNVDLGRRLVVFNIQALDGATRWRSTSSPASSGGSSAGARRAGGCARPCSSSTSAGASSSTSGAAASWRRWPAAPASTAWRW